ncbi:hypothetical protein [Paenimyroides baculatum]|nr:hypothetical protein [Paenimyroides baculatum]
MNIQIDKKEIIPLSDFTLGWRFDKVNNSDISDYDKNEIFALSENESKRLNKIIDYYEIESNRIGKYLETDWFSANLRIGINNTSIPVINAEFETVVYLSPIDCKKFPASRGIPIKNPIFTVFLEIFFR